MKEDYPHGTVTLARLFAAQGHWDKAVDIYRRLLEQEPGRRDIAQALAEAEQQVIAVGREPSGDLASLFRRWIDLVLKYDRLCKLKRLKSRF
jgi:lipopolysaccharide biosynthesis regulator YciM